MEKRTLPYYNSNNDISDFRITRRTKRASIKLEKHYTILESVPKDKKDLYATVLNETFKKAIKIK